MRAAQRAGVHSPHTESCLLENMKTLYIDDNEKLGKLTYSQWLEELSLPESVASEMQRVGIHPADGLQKGNHGSRQGALSAGSAAGDDGEAAFLQHSAPEQAGQNETQPGSNETQSDEEGVLSNSTKQKGVFSLNKMMVRGDNVVMKKSLFFAPPHFLIYFPISPFPSP